jgi:hypothetical protein
MCGRVFDTDNPYLNISYQKNNPLCPNCGSSDCDVSTERVLPYCRVCAKTLDIGERYSICSKRGFYCRDCFLKKIKPYL